MTGTGAPSVYVRLLGPVRVQRGGQDAGRMTPQQQRFLAVLALSAGKPVGYDVLQRTIWPEEKPASTTSALHGLAHDLRSVLGSRQPTDGCGNVLKTGSRYYQLLLAREQVDACEFRRLRDSARRCYADDDLAEALKQFDAALSLWDYPLTGLEDRWAEDTRKTLTDDHRAVLTDRLAILIRMGRHAEVIGDLDALVRDHPDDARFWGLYMRALYLSGREPEALEAFDRAREYWNDGGTGSEPPAGLFDLYRRIKRQDKTLRPPPYSGRQPAKPADQLQLPAGLEVRYSLPPDVTGFTGRDAELAELLAAASADSAMVCAIVGMPGVGKTALAVRAARLLADKFPDRCLFIDLRAHATGHDSLSAETALAVLLAKVGVDVRALHGDVDRWADVWKDQMRGKRALLVLDNASSSAQVTPLLPGTGGSLVLVTSRRRLADLPGMVAPLVLDVLPPDTAAEMFVRLAPRARTDHPERVASLVRQAGSLPLAISLLARFYNAHPRWDLVNLISETTESLLTMAAEATTVAAAFEVSYRHLPAERQHFLGRLALHPGSELEAYGTAALAGIGLDSAGEHLSALHDEALLTEIGYRRYAMHDLIRRYARNRATEQNIERDQPLDQLFAFYAHTSANAANQLGYRPTHRPDIPAPPAAMPALTERALALTWLRAERANLQACLDSATDSANHPWVMTLTASLSPLLEREGPWPEAVRRYEAAARSAQQAGDGADHACALRQLGAARQVTGDHPGAARALEQALKLYRNLGDLTGQADVLLQLGALGRIPGEQSAAAQALEIALGSQRPRPREQQADAIRSLDEMRLNGSSYPVGAQALADALEIYRGQSNRQGEANALAELGVVQMRAADYPAATRSLQEAVRIHHAVDNGPGEARALNNLGNLQLLTGDYAEAAKAVKAALRIHQAWGNRPGEADALDHLALVQLLTGERLAAGRTAEEALKIYQIIGQPLGQANALRVLAAVQLAAGHNEAAADALDQALTIYSRLGWQDSEIATLNNLGAIRQAARPPGHGGWRDFASTIAHSQDLLGHAWAIDLLGHAWAIAGHLGPAAAKKVADKLAALALEKLPQQPCQPAEPADQPVPTPATDDQLLARLQAVFGPVADMLRDLRQRTFTDPPE